MPLVETALQDGCFTITLADVEGRNTLSGALTAELGSALTRADEDPDVRVVVLTNSGRVFCAGANLREQSGDAASIKGVGLVDLLNTIRSSPKPYVGRLAGHCVAGGMGLAAALDISVAIDDAKFGFTEVRVGVAPAIISVICLPKMRPADASAAFLRGNRFDGTEAARLGLVNYAVPVDQLDEQVDAIVDDLLAGGPNALAAAKSLTTRVPTMTRDDAFGWAEQLSTSLFRSEEAVEGMRSYLDKKPAPWTIDGGRSQ
ncbi:MAG: enoyl-CoA hydratase/isomerase family protein [Acidobacteria bacterium]|nr:enoyl-CoA hydratase/isomerase family protein [Acidobacteriota bacterium]